MYSRCIQWQEEAKKRQGAGQEDTSKRPNGGGQEETKRRPGRGWEGARRRTGRGEEEQKDWHEFAVYSKITQGVVKVSCLHLETCNPPTRKINRPPNIKFSKLPRRKRRSITTASCLRLLGSTVMFPRCLSLSLFLSLSLSLSVSLSLPRSLSLSLSPCVQHIIPKLYYYCYFSSEELLVKSRYHHTYENCVFSICKGVHL